MTAKGRLRLGGITTSADSLKNLDRGMKGPVNDKVFMPEGTNSLRKIRIISVQKHLQMSEGNHRTHLRTVTREDLGQVEVLQDRHLLVTLKGSPAKVTFLLPLKELEVTDPQAVHLGLDDVGDGRVAAAVAGGVAGPPPSLDATGAHCRLDLEGLFVVNMS